MGNFPSTVAEATLSGHIQDIIDGITNPAQQNENGDTILHLLASKGRLGSLERLIRERKSPEPLPFRVRNQHGQTPALTALDNRQNDFAKMILQIAPDGIVDTDNNGNNAFHHLALIGNASLFDEISNIKFDPASLDTALKTKNTHQHTPLETAIVNRHLGIVSTMRRQFPKLFVVRANIPPEFTPLHLAVYLKLISVVRLFSGDFNVLTPSGATPLDIALQADAPDYPTIQALIQGGADLTRPLCDGMLPLHKIISKKLYPALPILLTSLQAETIITLQDTEGLTPLRLALRLGDLEAFKQLIQHCPALKQQCTLLLAKEAIDLNREDFTLIILEEGGLNVNSTDDGQDCLLTHLILTRPALLPTMGKELIRRNAELFSKMNEKHPLTAPLHHLLCSSNNSEAIILQLLELVATQEQFVDDGSAHLTLSLQILRSYLAKEIDSYQKEQTRYTPEQKYLSQTKIMFATTLMLRLAKEMQALKTAELHQEAMCRLLRDVIKKTEDEFPRAYDRKSDTERFLSGIAYSASARIYSDPQTRPYVAGRFCFTFRTLIQLQDKIPEHVAELKRSQAAAAPTGVY